MEYDPQKRLINILSNNAQYETPVLSVSTVTYGSLLVPDTLSSSGSTSQYAVPVTAVLPPSA